MTTHIARPKPMLIAIALMAMTFTALGLGDDENTGPADTKSGRPAELITVSGQPKAGAPAAAAPRSADAPTSGPGRAWRGRPGGPGQQRPMLDSIARWHDADGRLQEAARRFKENNARREQIMASLTEKKDRLKPGQIDPISVLERKEIDRQLGQMHTLIEVDRANNEDAARILRQAIVNRERWMPTLGKLIDDSLAGTRITNTERDRMKRWREGIAALKKDDAHGFVTQVMGVDYGEYLIESVPTLVRRPPAGGPPHGMAPGEMRRNMIGRLSQLERQQAVLRQDLERQDQEIARLRQMLQADEPGQKRPGPADNNASPTDQTGSSDR